jgi:formate-dependent nitrite reductase membrane component NrfD
MTTWQKVELFAGLSIFAFIFLIWASVFLKELPSLLHNSWNRIAFAAFLLAALFGAIRVFGGFSTETVSGHWLDFLWAGALGIGMEISALRRLHSEQKGTVARETWGSSGGLLLVVGLFPIIWSGASLYMAILGWH